MRMRPWSVPLVLAALSACGTEVTVRPTAPPSAPPPAVPGGPPPAPEATWPVVRIDEVLPGNGSLGVDEQGEREDWVDLYNPGSEEVDLGGWSLTDGGERFTFPPETVLAGRAHLLVWADGEPEDGPMHAPFRLAREGEALALLAPDGAAVDRVEWPSLADDVVYGRFPSGSPFLAPSIVATPWNDNPTDPGLSADPTDALFPDPEVIRIDLWVDQADLDALAVDPDRVVRAGIAFEESWLDPVGLTLKGGKGSVRTIEEKVGFRIDADRFVPGQRLRGKEHLTLNNLVQDRSTVNQRLAYQLMRDAGIPAPRTAYVELWMNGGYRGLYLNVESPDEDFLERWYDDAEGNLYEGAYGVDLRPGQAEAFDLDVQGDADVADRSDLEELIAFLDQEHPSDEDLPELERRLDLDEWLRAMAAETLVGHWDGYTHNRNNYRLYHEPTADRWSLLPWGTDQTFRKALDPWAPHGKVAKFCLAVPECARRYDLALRDMADRLEAFGCADRVEEVWWRIEPLYEADPYREGTTQSITHFALGTINYCDASVARIRGWL